MGVVLSIHLYNWESGREGGGGRHDLRFCVEDKVNSSFVILHLHLNFSHCQNDIENIQG